METWEGTIAWLRERNDRLRAAVVRATGLIASLRKKDAELRAGVRYLKGENAALASRVEKLELALDLDKLLSTQSVLSKALYGSRSERQKKPGTVRKRGQQHDTAGQAHQASRPPAPDPHALEAQVKHHPAGAVKRVLQQQSVDPPHQR